MFVYLALPTLKKTNKLPPEKSQGILFYLEFFIIISFYFVSIQWSQ